MTNTAMIQCIQCATRLYFSCEVIRISFFKETASRLCSSVMSALVEQIKRLTLCLPRFKHFKIICFLSRPAVTKMMTLILSTSILAACAGQSREQIMPTPQSAEAERLAPQIGTFGFDRSEEHTSALQSLMRISYA